MRLNLVVGGSAFQHKRIHKTAWVSPDLSTENQIDHVCIGRKFRGSLQDVCVKRGADVSSDHHLLIAKLKLKLKRDWTGDSCQHLRCDTAKLLKDTIKEQEFKIVFLNKPKLRELGCSCLDTSCCDRTGVHPYRSTQFLDLCEHIDLHSK